MQTNNRQYIELTHGKVELPVFMPVGTKGSVKGMPPFVLKELGVDIILGNTYHLYLRPGHDLIKTFGGLHKFIAWDRPILTDSGGFQVFSLSKIRKITEEGALFSSHIDGSKHMLTPELSMQIQDALGSDIRMVFDECPPHDADKTYIKKSLDLTTRWAKRCKDEWERLGAKDKLFGIVQGGMFDDMRKESIQKLQEIGFSGYAIGGLSVGESKQQMYDALEALMPHMPKDNPTYLMGVGEPEDLIFAISKGVKMFDCVIPTRNARNAGLFTFNGKISIKNAKYKEDQNPVEAGCDCYACQNFSAGYLRHLFLSKELLSYYLNTVHNLRFFMRLMDKIKKSLFEGNFDKFSAEFLKNYLGK